MTVRVNKFSFPLYYTSTVHFFHHCAAGNARKESSLNDDQKKQKIDECPSLLVYFSYNFNFHSFLAGPTCTIKDYLAFMDGSNLTPPINAYARVRRFIQSLETVNLPFFLQAKEEPSSLVGHDILLVLLLSSQMTDCSFQLHTHTHTQHSTQC